VRPLMEQRAMSTQVVPTGTKIENPASFSVLDPIKDAAQISQILGSDKFKVAVQNASDLLSNVTDLLSLVSVVTPALRIFIAGDGTPTIGIGLTIDTDLSNKLKAIRNVTPKKVRDVIDSLGGATGAVIFGINDKSDGVNINTSLTVKAPDFSNSAFKSVSNIIEGATAFGVNLSSDLEVKISNNIAVTRNSVSNQFKIGANLNIKGSKGASLSVNTDFTDGRGSAVISVDGVLTKVNFVSQKISVGGGNDYFDSIANELKLIGVDIDPSGTISDRTFFSIPDNDLNSFNNTEIFSVKLKDGSFIGFRTFQARGKFIDDNPNIRHCGQSLT
jgi:hypothetical protein